MDESFLKIERQTARIQFCILLCRFIQTPSCGMYRRHQPNTTAGLFPSSGDLHLVLYHVVCGIVAMSCPPQSVEKSEDSLQYDGSEN